MTARKKKIYEIIFEADTPAGKAFDITIIVLIFLSVLLVLLDSITPVREKYSVLIHLLEWLVTAI